MAESTIVPISDPNRGFQTWHIAELFSGQDGEGRYVPNKDDMVVSYAAGLQLYRVKAVDYTTGLSELDLIELNDSTGADEVDSRLLGAGPGKISESYRAYLDTSVIPYTLAFDARLKVYGTTAKSVKIIRGTQIENGEVISRQYDQQGELLGDSIPLELVLTETGDNLAIKTPKVGSCSVSLPDGEIVTAIVYDDVGAVVSTSVLLIKNTGFIRSLNESVKYVTGIELESPFLSPADNRVLECPINIPVDAITRRGIVHYSDGSRKTLPIDGTKFALFGLQRFISTILGQEQPLSLIYYLSPAEVSYGSVPGDTMHITEKYLATTVNVDGAYSVKLFSYPTWIDAVNGYRLEHFLYNLERDEVFVVTSLVEVAANSPAFDPLAYGITQGITFALDLSKVADRFKNYRHLQTTRVTLLRPGLDSATNWTVTYDNTKPAYGVTDDGAGLKANVEFVNSNLWRLTVDNGFGSMEHWLREIYDKTLPLYDETAEATPPVPNYFKLIAGAYEMEAPVSMWNHEFTVNNLLDAGENVYLRFFRRTSTTDLQLSTAALIMRQIN
jgi:hypothetical protein